MTTYDRHSTFAVGRPLIVRAATTTSAAVFSVSRSITGPTSYTRSVSFVSAAQPAASRTVMPVGITYNRSSTVAVGRAPAIRGMGVTAAAVFSVSRVVGNVGVGVFYDRSSKVVAGRFPLIRSATFISAAAPAASRVIVLHGVIERSTTPSGGAGTGATGLLLALQPVPGRSVSFSRLLASNVPARSATFASEARLLVSRATQRDRSVAFITAAVAIANKVSSGNRNRNLTIATDLQVRMSVTKVRDLQRGVQLVSALQVSASRMVGVTPIYSRTVQVASAARYGGSVLVQHSLASRAFLVASAIRYSATTQPTPIVSILRLPLTLAGVDEAGRTLHYRQGDTDPWLALEVRQADGSLLLLDDVALVMVEIRRFAGDHELVLSQQAAIAVDGRSVRVQLAEAEWRAWAYGVDARLVWSQGHVTTVPTRAEDKLSLLVR